MKDIEHNENFRILIVDDVSQNIQIVANILKAEGYQMTYAQSGKAALAKAWSHNFDLILLDIMMPEMNGFEVCIKLKQYPETKDIPVIFLTAKSDTESIVKGFKVGATDYVTKPFNRMELVARVRTHLALRESQKALQTSEEHLREAVAAKDKFFSIIAHDLRSPFHNLFHLHEFLEDDIDTFDREQLVEFFKSLCENATRTFNLLENLLSWAKTQTGSVKFAPVSFSVSGLAKNIAKLLKSSADEKNITLTSGIDEDITAYGDTDMISMILRNLVTNAIKFTPKHGKITIDGEKKDNHVEITVADTGMGISEENIRKLFRIDIQFSSFGTQEERGSGLGLILCKEFAEKNSGKIWVESEVSKGSRFKFTLPGTKNYVRKR